MEQTKPTKGIPRNVWYLIGMVLLLLMAFFIGRYSVQSINSSSSSSLNTNLQLINKIFLFPVKNDAGDELTKIQYDVLSAETQPSIMINGQKGLPIKGKVFLIITIKLTNIFDKNIQINSRDYVRLQVNNKPDLLAADLHNDPVEVDAISTKLTRVGFVVSTTDKHIQLLVGEIDGKKLIIPLQFLRKK